VPTQDATFGDRNTEKDEEGEDSPDVVLYDGAPGTLARGEPDADVDSRTVSLSRTSSESVYDVKMALQRQPEATPTDTIEKIDAPLFPSVTGRRGAHELRSRFHEEVYRSLNATGFCFARNCVPTKRFPAETPAGMADISPRPPSLKPVSQPNSCLSLYTQCCANVCVRPNSGLLHCLCTALDSFSIQTISLRNNYMGKKGLAPLLEVCQANAGLLEVVLSGSGLCNSCVELIVSYLGGHPSLSHLDLSENRHITMLSAGLLKQLVLSNRNLRVVCLHNTGITLPYQRYLTRTMEAIRREAGD
jgi:hypothetical protein